MHGNYSAFQFGNYFSCRVIKLTSPNLNYIIIFGCVLLMVGNVFVVSPSEDPSVLAAFCPVSSAVTIYFSTYFLV